MNATPDAKKSIPGHPKIHTSPNSLHLQQCIEQTTIQSTARSQVAQWVQALKPDITYKKPTLRSN